MYDIEFLMKSLAFHTQHSLKAGLFAHKRIMLICFKLTSVALLRNVWWDKIDSLQDHHAHPIVYTFLGPFRAFWSIIHRISMGENDLQQGNGKKCGWSIMFDNGWRWLEETKSMKIVRTSSKHENVKMNGTRKGHT